MAYSVTGQRQAPQASLSFPFCSSPLAMPAAPSAKPCSVWPERWTLVSWPRTPNVDALKAPRPHGLRLAGPHGEAGRKTLPLRPALPPLGQVNSGCYAHSFRESSVYFAHRLHWKFHHICHKNKEHKRMSIYL